MSSHLYCISGLGADESVFTKLVCKDHEIHFLQWLVPVNDESIDSYAKRMIAQIKHKDPLLLGLSFGGIMCIEIARLIPVRGVILVSSIKTYRAIPYWMRLSGKLKLNRIFPMRSFKLIEPIENYNLGIETKEEKIMVSAYRRNVNRIYSDWAINNILNWKNEWVPDNIYQIHGKKDRIFPFRKVKADYLIPTGGHLMIMNRSKQVNEAINKIVSSLNHT